MRFGEAAWRALTWQNPIALAGNDRPRVPPPRIVACLLPGCPWGHHPAAIDCRDYLADDEGRVTERGCGA